MEIKELLKELTDAPGISGYELEAGQVAMKHLKEYSDEAEIDKLGSVIALKRGEQTGERRYKVLLAAHLDEIGLMVTKIEDGGFIRITQVGGIDVTILPGQAVTILGRETIKGVVGAKPPHLQEPGESGKPIAMEDLYINTGRSKEELANLVDVGMLVRIESEFIELNGGCVSARAMDDRAGVAVMVETLHD